MSDKMFSINVKWLNGDIVNLVTEKCTLRRLIPQQTSEPFFKVCFFRDGEAVSHSYTVTRDEELCILIRDSSPVFIFFQSPISEEDLYIRVPQWGDMKPFSQYQPSESDEVYIDYLSYRSFFNEDDRQKLQDRLGLTNVKGNLSYYDLLIFCTTIRSMQFGSTPLRWKDFIKRMSLLLSENIEHVSFPDVDSEMKRELLRSSDWASYCVFR